MGGGNKNPRISFSKNGVINFNEAACQLMDLTVTDKLTLCQDEENPENWYFFKDKENGFDVRKSYDKKGVLFNHSKLTAELLKAFGLDEGMTHGFLIAGQPTIIKGDKTKYWGLIVRS